MLKFAGAWQTMRVRTLSDLPRQAEENFGDKVAVRVAGVSLSFREINQLVDACAAGLMGLELKAGDRVILHLPNSWEWVVSYYAIARLGAVNIPANILLVSEEIAFIAVDSEAAAIIAPSDRISSIQKALEPNSLIRCIGVGASIPAGVVDWSALIHGSSNSIGARVDPRATATIAYTSGTTGKSKGAVLTHGSIVMNTAMTANMHMRTSTDIVVTGLPCAHVYGNVVMNDAFLCGYTLVLLQRFDAEEALEAIDQYRATLFEGVPTMYNYILGAASLPRRKLTSLTRVTVGGQTMPLPQLEATRARFGCPILELWGMTEIAGLGTTHPLYAPEKLGSIGLPLPFAQCKIAKLDNPVDEAAVGEFGELLFRGPTTMRGYYGKESETAEVLLPDGWLKTGDIAYRDVDGYLYVVDRLKEMIITAGYNIYPSEVERVLAEHPAVRLVAVGSVPHGAKGEVAHAYVVLTPNAAIKSEELEEYCRSRLAAYKVPKAFHFVRDFPKTSSGKIVRRELWKLSQP